MGNDNIFKILVVDDSPELLDITVRTLKKENYMVSSAGSAAGCMLSLKRDRPDIILLDIMLPDGNGLEICKQIKNDPAFSSVFVILLSSLKTESVDVSEGLEVGADGYILRPVKSRELLARISAACRIITAEKKLKASHAIYQAIFDSTGTATLMVEEDTTISMANNECYSLTGYTSEELIGQKWTRFVSPESLEEMLKNKNLRRQSPSLAPKKYEVKLLNRKGEKRFALLDIGLVPNTHQSIVSILDITERKQAEEALQKSHKQLEISKSAALNLLEDIKEEMSQRQHAEEEIKRLNIELEKRVIERTAQLETANKELESFAYSVSHDLRAPLRAIDGFSNFILKDYSQKLDPEGIRYFGLIRSNIQKMDRLITDILSLSRIVRGGHNPSKVIMSDMAISLFVETVATEIREKICLTIDSLPEAYADSTYIKQVWINLISNAVKFSSLNDRPEIRISGYSEEGVNVYFVKDNGVGFNPEYSHKLFGVFQRLHKAEEFEGTGVGLAIVQRIINRHGGKVWAESEEGRGATFFFSLPEKSRE